MGSATPVYSPFEGKTELVEIKVKVGDIVAKARARVPREDWSARLRPTSTEGLGAAERDFTSLLERHGARPTLLARYHREAWVSSVDHYARVTFDRRLLYQACAQHDLRGEQRGWRSSDDGCWSSTIIPTLATSSRKC